MLRRRTVSVACGVAARGLSQGHDALQLRGAPDPPMMTQDPVQPLDFNPHIEWYEYPKEVWEPKFPYTNDECVRYLDERWDSSAEEMAEKYGMRVSPPPRGAFWIAWFTGFWYVWWNLWAAYRSAPDHPTWPMYRQAIQASPNCPTVGEDEVYLDQWQMPGGRQRTAKHDQFWAWKPPVKRDGAENPWAIKLERKDPSEWKHMCGN